MAEGGYLGFSELQYVHMPLPGERLVAFLSDGAFEEQRGDRNRHADRAGDRHDRTCACAQSSPPRRAVDPERAPRQAGPARDGEGEGSGREVGGGPRPRWDPRDAHSRGDRQTRHGHSRRDGAGRGGSRWAHAGPGFAPVT